MIFAIRSVLLFSDGMTGRDWWRVDDVIDDVFADLSWCDVDSDDDDADDDDNDGSDANAFIGDDVVEFDFDK